MVHHFLYTCPRVFKKPKKLTHKLYRCWVGNLIETLSLLDYTHVSSLAIIQGPSRITLWASHSEPSTTQMCPLLCIFPILCILLVYIYVQEHFLEKNRTYPYFSRFSVTDLNIGSSWTSTSNSLSSMIGDIGYA